MPPVVCERPKMTRAMWESLKAHIMRQRQRKKQELEADAEVERQRKERERQLKQDSMTLTETNTQLAKLDASLTQLKEEKHQLFLQLKKVLNEDETRKRQMINKEASEMVNMNYGGQGGLQMSGQPAQMFLQPIALARPPMFKISTVPHSQPHGQPTLLPHGTMKRSRSPSPPPHNYKFGPFKPPQHTVHAYPHKSAMGLQYYHNPASSQPPQIQNHPSVTFSGNQGVSAAHQQQQQQGSNSQQQHPPALYTYAGPPPTRSPQSSREEPPKHISQSPHNIYLQQQSQNLTREYVLHHQMQVKQHPSNQQQKFADENPKYYPPPSHQGGMNLLRPAPHMNLHPGLQIQQSQGAPSGGITSGFPIRTQPSVSSYQGRPPSPQVVYAGQGPPRLNYNPHGQPSSSPHGNPHGSVTLARYQLPPGMSRDRERD